MSRSPRRPVAREPRGPVPDVIAPGLDALFVGINPGFASARAGHHFADGPGMSALRLTLLGVGAMNSPRFAPAGLLVEHGRCQVAIDGGPRAAAAGRLDAWLVCDERSELRRELKELAQAHGLEPRVAAFVAGDLRIEPHSVVHTSHPTFGYRIEAAGGTAAWAPEFLEFPAWAAGADLLLAEAAGWSRPIRFAGGVGGHASTLQVSAEARAHRVRRLVFAHIGRPAIRAVDAGLRPPFGSFGRDGQRLVLRPKRS